MQCTNHTTCTFNRLRLASRRFQKFRSQHCPRAGNETTCSNKSKLHFAGCSNCFTVFRFTSGISAAIRQAITPPPPRRRDHHAACIDPGNGGEGRHPSHGRHPAASRPAAPLRPQGRSLLCSVALAQGPSHDLTPASCRTSSLASRPAPPCLPASTLWQRPSQPPLAPRGAAS